MIRGGAFLAPRAPPELRTGLLSTLLTSREPTGTVLVDLSYQQVPTR
jgi:hypothetical protein